MAGDLLGVPDRKGEISIRIKGSTSFHELTERAITSLSPGQMDKKLLHIHPIIS